MMTNRHASRRRDQAGLTMVVVLILLSVMLLGGLALARMTTSGTMVAGNIAFRERALQASEVGINTAFAAIRAAGFNEEPGNGAWYFASAAPLDADQLPIGIDIENGAQVNVGAAGAGGVYNIRFVVERMCSTPTVTDPMRECLLREAEPDVGCTPGPASPCAAIDPTTGRQFRITARVLGPKGTRTIVQAMVTRGN